MTPIKFNTSKQKDRQKCDNVFLGYTTYEACIVIKI